MCVCVYWRTPYIAWYSIVAVVVKCSSHENYVLFLATTATCVSMASQVSGKYISVMYVHGMEVQCVKLLAIGVSL